MCRCNERRAAIVAGVKAVVRGDTAAAAAEAKFITRSSVEDAKAAFQAKVTAARSKLSRR